MQSGFGPIAVPVPLSLAAPVHGCVQAPAPGICVSSPPRCSPPPHHRAPLRLWTTCPIWARICSWFLCPHGPSHPPPSTPTCQRHDCPGCLRQPSQTSTSRQPGPTEDYSSQCGGCVPNSMCWRSRSPLGLWGRMCPRCVSPGGASRRLWCPPAWGSTLSHLYVARGLCPCLFLQRHLPLDLGLSRDTMMSPRGPSSHLHRLFPQMSPYS